MAYDTLVLDYESYYCSKTYSLRRMSNLAYVRDPRFKAHGAAFKFNKEPAYWVTGQSLPEHFAAIDWSNTLLIGHNMAFDGHVASHHYGVRPRLYVDTLGMARAVLGGTIPSLSLDALGEHFGHGGKLDKGRALQAVDGKRDISPEEEAQLGLYACIDAEQTALIFRDLWPDFPKSMLDVMDWTIRMITEPTLMLNADVMRKVHEDEVELKRLALANCRLTRTQLNSNQQLANILRDLGVDPPVKVSRTTGKTTYAFSKTDQEFVDLQDHPDPDVRDIVLARLAVKSSIEETRSKAYLDLADGSPCPVPLRFCGAQQTGRLSGFDGFNWQNVGRASGIRYGVEPMEGFGLVESDLSNIELRVVAKICHQQDVLDTLAKGGDSYSDFASSVFGVLVTKALAKTDEIIAGYRQTGKVGMLSCQYRVAAKTFQKMLWVQAGLRISLDEAERIVKHYRRTYANISGMWTRLDRQLDLMAKGIVPPPIHPDHPFTWCVDGVVLPSGFKIKYPDLRYETDPHTGQRSLVFTSYGGKAAGRKFLHGGSCLENLSQAMAREIIDPMITKIRKRYRAALQVHDSVLCPVPLAEADEAVAWIREIMSTPPTFWPDLPTACEVGWGMNYGSIKKS